LPIVEAAADICSLKYDPAGDNGRRLRRITDHIAACAFAVHENVNPGNKEVHDSAVAPPEPCSMAD
jgi:alanyl-tRNA synthetase